MNKTQFLIILSVLFELDTANKLPWDEWSWDTPQQPIEYFFRRHQRMPIKRPNSECQCPPHKECTIEYKLNEDALHFLSMQGLINKTQSGQEEQLTDPVRMRAKREADENEAEDCCCPSSTLMMATFITDKKYNDFVDRFDKKQDPPISQPGV